MVLMKIWNWCACTRYARARRICFIHIYHRRYIYIYHFKWCLWKFFLKKHTQTNTKYCYLNLYYMIYSLLNLKVIFIFQIQDYHHQHSSSSKKRNKKSKKRSRSHTRSRSRSRSRAGRSRSKSNERSRKRYAWM